MQKSRVKNTFLFILFLLIGAALIWYLVYGMGVRRSVAGIGDPVQKEAEGEVKMTVGDYDVTVSYLYSYEIEALVVHTKDYGGFDIGNRLSPKDLALAWGKVAEYNEEIDFHWDQSNRWVVWEVDSYSELGKVGGMEEVQHHLSNNHIIPADSSVKWDLKKVRRGDHIRLKGYLVNIDGRDSNGSTFTWHSSTSREDLGKGACEVIYVEEIEWLDK